MLFSKAKVTDFFNGYVVSMIKIDISTKLN